MPKLSPFRLRPWFRPMVWGTQNLAPWYDYKAEDQPIGEVWLSGDTSVVDTGPLAGKPLEAVFREHKQDLLGPTLHPQERFPLLMKVLFPREKLSVQVHPGDAMAREHGEPHGKTECWYVLEADPGAEVALGLQSGTTLPDVKKAIENKTLESLLAPVPVQKEDMIFVDAGTVHAIFPGVVILETQQNSDMTYRLYDYGRPRELHLKDGLQAIRLHTNAGKKQPTPESSEGSEAAGTNRDLLIRSNYFSVERTRLVSENRTVSFSLPVDRRSQTGSAQLIFVSAGAGMLHAPGEVPISLHRGDLAVVPACTAEWSMTASEPMEFLRAIPE